MELNLLTALTFLPCIRGQELQEQPVSMMFTFRPKPLSPGGLYDASRSTAYLEVTTSVAYDVECICTTYMSLSRLNHGLPRTQAHSEVVQGTAEFHHQIPNPFLPQP